MAAGCSTGKLVKAFQDAGKEAHGFDVSRIAQRHAKALGIDSVYHGSILDIPEEDGAYDACITTDVLEHLAPEDVDTAIAELARVARKYVFAKIAFKPESNRTWVEKIRDRYNLSDLHLTVWPMHKWVEAFKRLDCMHIATHNTMMVFKV